MKHGLSWIALTAACASASPPMSRAAEVDHHGTPPEAPSPLPPRQLSIDSLLATLSVREKVGQLIMPWQLSRYTAFDGEAYEEAARWVDEYHIGGLVVSVGSPMDAAVKLNSLQRRSHLPLIVAADLEAGSGMRMIGATVFPWPMAFGATGRDLDAYQLGRVTALEARAVGIHWTFSPVADLNNNPDNPVINTRSFGEDPLAVGPLIRAFIQGATEHGLFTTAKHFPGHGDTGVDSHIAVPVIDACWNRLDSLELAPFRAAIDAGVTSIMTGHVALPCLEDGHDLPATLSPRIMTDVLQDSLGFDGIVVTDALNMGAIVNEYGVGESAVLAFRAGSDILLYPSDVGQVFHAMVAAFEAGRISTERLNRSVRKLLDLKQTAGLFDTRVVPLDEIPDIVGVRAHQGIADDVAARALTLVQRGPIDDVRTGGSIALIVYDRETNLALGGALADELNALGRSVYRFRLFPASGAASFDSARTVIEQGDHVVFASGVRVVTGLGSISLPEAVVDLISATAREHSTTLVSFGSPYLLNQLPGYGGGFILGWHTIRAVQRSVARALAGDAPFSGRLPITLSPAFPRGHGIQIR